MRIQVNLESVQNTVFIFGAGASHDVIAKHTQPRHPHGADWQPPLTKDLVKSIPRFDHLIVQYPELKSLAGQIRSALLNDGNNFEDLMVGLREKAKTNAIRYRQLVQLRFYLRWLLYHCSSEYVYTGNQYATLISNLMDIKGDAEVTFVTFNYDTLVEQAMIDMRILPKNLDKLDHYIDSDIKLIKPHGSVNWIHRINDNLQKPTGDNDVVSILFSMFPNEEPKIDESEIRIDDHWSTGRSISDYRDPYIHYPALAIPLNKKSEFICPPTHIAALERVLSNAKNIVTIGWRGREEHFGAMLSSCRKNRPRLFVVSGGDRGKESAAEIKDHLNVSYLDNAKTDSFGEGFSGFIQKYDSGELEKLLSQP